MAEIYYLLKKTFTNRTDDGLHQNIEKIPLSPSSAQHIDRRKAAIDQLKVKLRTAFKADSSRSEESTQRRVTFQTPPIKRTPFEVRPALRQCERPCSGRAGDVSQQSRNSVQKSRQDERSRRHVPTGIDRIMVGKIWDGMGWYEASDSHPTVGWYGILLVSSYGTGDLWDIPWDVAKCG